MNRESKGVTGADKRATVLARRLEEEVLRRGWPVGEHLGREDELARHHGVSRAVLREALAITERDGLTRRERGRLGGVVVAAPSEGAVTAGLGNYLHLMDVPPAALAEAWGLLEQRATEWAMARCTPEQVRAFRQVAAQPDGGDPRQAWATAVRLHTRLMAMAGNRAAGLLGLALGQLWLMRVFLRMVLTHPPGSPAGQAESLALARQVVALRSRQLEAVAARQPARGPDGLQEQAPLFRWAFDAALNGPTELSAEQAEAVLVQLEAAHLALGPPRPPKRADALALQLHSHAACRRLQAPEGHPGRLETEPALMARFQVGRAVLREAVRYLERHAMVRMEKGQQGGLRLTQPQPLQAVRSAVLLFRFLNIDAAELDELSCELELAATRRLAAWQGAGQGAALARLAAVCQGWSGAAADVRAHLEQLYEAWLQLADNPVLDLWARVLRAYLQTERRQTEFSVPPDLSLRARPPEGGESTWERPFVDSSAAEMEAAYRVYLSRMAELVQALEQGDAALACRCALFARQAIRFLQPQVRQLDSMLDHLH